MEILKLLFTLFIVILFLYLVYVISRVLSGGNMLGAKGKNIRVLERIQLAKDSSILLRKAVDKVMVVGVTQSGMTTLRELEPEAVKDVEMPKAPPDFASAFKTALRDSIPNGRMRKQVGKWLHMEEEKNHDEAR